MKIVRQKNNNKILIVVVATIALIAISLLAIYFIRLNPSNTSNKDSTNLNTPTNNEIKAGQDIKKNAVDNSNKSDSNKQTVLVSLNGIQNNEQVIFDTLLQTISNEGQCTLIVTSGGQTVTKTATIFANPSSSSCRGFAVPISELPKGTWTATLNAVIGSISGTDSINIDVK